ncbi:TPA: leucyl aminopeptidase [Candidatus Woesearchaeota archaeon]|nr:leucyl aminopeptidase [archaeon]HIJ10780.1 leucyl aminopeptidase [Candidatus Woesearchaeota archaeon]
MKLTTQSGFNQNAGVLTIGIFEDGTGKPDGKLATEITRVKKQKLFSEKWGESYTTVLPPYQRVVFYGLGKKKEFTLEKLRKMLGKSITATKAAKQTSLTTNLAAVTPGDHDLIGRAAAEAVVLANYKFTKYFGKEKMQKEVDVKLTSFSWSGSTTKFGGGLKTGRIIAESANFVRDLVEDHAGFVTSSHMEKMAKQVAATSSKLKLRVMNQPEMKRLGMGSLLGVNAGSENPPKLLILEYKGGGKEKPIALVGKGITFDSGGYNLKPTRYIEDMKTDMAGSAAALGTVKAISQLGVKKNIMAVMGMCENMVSGHAQRPGDIVKAYNGKTIEIGNTDAEGRLVLADALAYIDDKYSPQIMVDMATLTGACVVALGYFAAAVMGKDQKLIDELIAAGAASGDRTWQLPFFDEYQNAMDGSISDLNNINQKGKGYEAGSITAGVFLSKFVKKARWAHIDIAGSAYWGVKGDYLSKGATGSGVRLLSYWLLDKK